MTTDELRGVLEFLRSAERLKNVTRTSWTSEGRRESVAAHTWRLSLMAVVLHSEFAGIDVARETIMQHNQGLNPSTIDYRFNLDYGASYTAYEPTIIELRRMLDAETLARSEAGGEAPRAS